MDLKRVDPVIKSMSYITDFVLTACYLVIGLIGISVGVFVVYKYGTPDEGFDFAINWFGYIFIISTGIKLITLVYTRWRLLQEDT